MTSLSHESAFPRTTGTDAGGDRPPPVTYEARGLIREVPLRPHEMRGAITPSNSLFMLAHLGIVRIDPQGWQVEVGGLVEGPLSLVLGDIARFPAARVEAVHQCAGSPLEPTVATRRVACVVWEGAWLRDILAEAGIDAGATHVWADGADAGMFAGEQVPYFRKDLPVGRVHADVLLATKLNGEPLPSRHGGPVRLVVPGFYGTNSVKWLWRLTLADRRADGVFTTRFYNDALPDGTTRPVYDLAPESIVVSPAPGEVVEPELDLFGWAWADGPVTHVEVSDDGGSHWEGADLGTRTERGWQPWRRRWRFASTGPATLLCRATDGLGRMQPMSGARNEVHWVTVDVRGTR